MSFEIKNAIEAGNFIQKILTDNGIKTEWQYDKHKYGTHINLIDTERNQIHHIKFVREPFRYFGKYFPQYKGELGDSLEENFVDSLRDDDWIYFCYPNKILRVKKKDFIKPQLWRDTNHGAKTCSFPLYAMDVFPDDMLKELEENDMNYSGTSTTQRVTGI